ncbi:hypothetical protein NL676_033889 [Syzygium grande]|nr:hypothetical protein NL676_033889 [Syzygium grande]
MRHQAVIGKERAGWTLPRVAVTRRRALGACRSMTARPASSGDVPPTIFLVSTSVGRVAPRGESLAVSRHDGKGWESVEGPPSRPGIACRRANTAKLRPEAWVMECKAGKAWKAEHKECGEARSDETQTHPGKCNDNGFCFNPPA